MFNSNQIDFLLSIFFVLLALSLIVLGILRKRKGYDSAFSLKTERAHKGLLRATQLVFWLPMSLILSVLLVILVMLTGLFN